MLSLNTYNHTFSAMHCAFYMCIYIRVGKTGLASLVHFKPISKMFQTSQLQNTQKINILKNNF